MPAERQVNFFNHFNDYSIEPNDLVARLEKEFYPKDRQKLSVPLAIPSIIQTIYKNIVPYVRVQGSSTFKVSANTTTG
jgi:hypothetical protein